MPVIVTIITWVAIEESRSRAQAKKIKILRQIAGKTERNKWYE